MISGIRKFEIDSEYYFKEGCFITEISNSIDDEEVSIARARVEPGISTIWHALSNTDERYLILEGLGSVEIGHAKAISVTPGDVVLIPARTRQRITNVGKSDLVFAAICTPRFKKENYAELE